MRTFLEKIEIERHALKLVNSSMGSPELHGLNEHAIARWRSSTPDARARVAEMLLLLSQLTRLLTERAGGDGVWEVDVPEVEVELLLMELASVVGAGAPTAASPGASPTTPPDAPPAH
jgi:hypothetical protein